MSEWMRGNLDLQRKERRAKPGEIGRREKQHRSKQERTNGDINIYRKEREAAWIKLGKNERQSI
jgi:hypothetical protein